MLPSKGFFNDIPCPFGKSKCTRPYCHFSHRRKLNETIVEEVNIETKPIEPEVPTYKPTPKSELANIKNHIPISYVPDLSYRTNRPTRPTPKFEKPTYKPTPLNILSSASNNQGTSLEKESNGGESSEEFKVIQKIKLDIASVEYNPTISLQEDINFDNLSAELDLLDTIIDEAVKPESVPEVVEKKSSGSNNNNKKKSSSKSSSSSHKSSSSSSKHKSDKNKDKHKSKHREKDRHGEKSREEDKHLGRDLGKTKHRSQNTDKKKSRSSSKSQHKSKPESKTITKTSVEAEIETEPVDVDFFDIKFEEEEEDTFLECYKIFNEYKAPDTQLPPLQEEITPEVSHQSEADSNSKKRIAHSSSSNNSDTKKVFIKPKPVQSAAQIMANRFKLARQNQANNEQRNIVNEMKHVVKRPAPTVAEPTVIKHPKMQTKIKAIESTTNLVDSIINEAKSKPKKITPVMNVNMIQRAKARIDQIAKQKAAESLQKTPAQNIKSTNKRIAHIPDVSLSDIPDVLNAEKSKLPINVRTRFLTMIADECVKLYLIRDEAYTRALNEEFTCYEKCKVLVTYKNSAMLAVSRIRKELQERDRLGQGPIGLGETTSCNTNGDIKKKQFYEQVKKYLLSEMELDIHGYPQLSELPGHAVIKNRKHRPSVKLEENQRKCCRCSKIYLVDGLGFVRRAEECVYHPLKKRTFRGESNYMCCKSSDDNGCATASTHVAEMAEDAELGGYQMTLQPELDDDPRSYAVYALDCEMCYTTKGLELTRVTIVDADCKTVYETLVKPLNAIIDYNTNFSGITKEQMDKTSTSILQVQANILHLCNSKTILVGHSLESDMKALKIIHGSIIDTSVMFPHKMGLPHKRALRQLASDFLKRIIQNSVDGHDSAEDAIACMDLLKWKLKDELKVRGIKGTLAGL